MTDLHPALDGEPCTEHQDCCPHEDCPWPVEPGVDDVSDGPRCQFCQHPIDDGHRPWCPVRGGDNQ